MHVMEKALLFYSPSDPFIEVEFLREFPILTYHKLLVRPVHFVHSVHSVLFFTRFLRFLGNCRISPSMPTLTCGNYLRLLASGNSEKLVR